MLIFEVGLSIIFAEFGDDSKQMLSVIKDRFKPRNEDYKYLVEAHGPGVFCTCWISENQILKVMIKGERGRYIWVNIDNLYLSYPNGTVIGPDTIYNHHLTGSRNSGRYPWSESVNKYIRHDEIVVKAAIREWGITPKKVIFNGPATIVIWQDGTKTVVKKTDGDTDDREKAVMYAILKKEFGSRANMNRYLKQFFKEEHNE